MASADAATLAALLPSSNAPMNRSRACSRRLTIAARWLPCFSSRSMRAREEAVSAVSLAAKKNESKTQTRTMRMATQS